MYPLYRLAAVVGLVLACAATSQAATTQGFNFDGIMSLIYDDSSGNVFVENSPLPNPSVLRVRIDSSGGLLLPANAQPNNLAGGASTTNILWDAPANFLGTGSFLGDILNPGHSLATLLSDLTITYRMDGADTQTGDLIHGTFGTTQGNPVLPGAGADGFWRFFDVESGQFFDPPLAHGYEYRMDGGSLFTKVGLPLGLGNNFTITSSEGTVSGLPEGGMHVFTSGVSDFQITGISPPVDPNDPAAFPLYLEFDTPTASFNMTALVVPEPAALTLVGMALLGLIGMGRRRK